MAVSSAVVAGTNATAAQYNNLRTDAITQLRRIYFAIDGTIPVGNDLQSFTVPAGMTITKIKHRCETGSCTMRIQNGSGDVKASIAVTTAYASETTGLTNTVCVEGDEIRLDITAIGTTPTYLHVLIYLTETI